MTGTTARKVSTMDRWWVSQDGWLGHVDQLVSMSGAAMARRRFSCV